MLLEKRIPFGYIISMIKADIIYVMSIAILFYVIKYYFLDYLPEIPLSLVAVLGTSISLILAFRINQSYDRWWEARKIWGAIVNDSRTLVMQVSSFISAENMEKPEVKKMYRQIAYRQIGWCYCLGQALRNGDPLEGMTAFIPGEEIERIKNQNNKPNAMLLQHAQDISGLHSTGIINDVQQVALDGTVMRLCDSMGKSERIKGTIFPRTYSLIVHFIIYLFVVFLSLGLVETVGLYEIPILTVIASAFFLIEKTGIHMQDPFKNRPTDTPVTAIARTIEINIRELLFEKDVPKPIVPEGYYLK